MALSEYMWRGRTWQFEESEAPADAVPVQRKAAPTSNKARRPANTARSPRTKKAE